MKKFYFLIISLFLNFENTLNAQFGQGLLLDGCNNYLEVAASSQLLKGGGGITIEAWIFPNCDDENRMIVSKEWCNNQYGYYLSVFNGRLLWSISSNGFCVLTSNYQTANVVIPKNVFTHVAIVHDVNSISLYVNGSLAAGQYISGSYIPIYPSDEPIRIGAYKDVGGSFGHFFSGIIDELRFYDAPLTAQQISQNYNTTLSGNEPNLVLYYDMEDNTGSGQNLRIDNKSAGYGQHFAIADGFMGNRPILVNNDEYINQDLVLEDEIVICTNTTISLNLDAYKEIWWSTGQRTESINVINEGLYRVTVETELCRFLYDEINVISEVIEVTEVLEICSNDSIYFDGRWIKSPGIYQELRITQGVCDSLITLDLYILDPISTSNVLEYCRGDSVMINGTWIKSSGLYQENNISYNGCDSLTQLTLIFHDTIRLDSTIQLCQGDSVMINGSWVFDQGQITIQSNTLEGCDSIAIYTVNLIPTAFIFDTLNLCQGDSIFVNDTWYSESQTITYTDNSSFCPVNNSATILVNPNYTFLNEVDICKNDSIYFNNQWLNSGGLYQEILISQQGCDSIYNLNLTIIDTIRSMSVVELCQGDSIFINGLWVYDEGDISIYGTTINGCDSISVISIELIPIPTLLDTFDLCPGDSLLINEVWYFDTQTVTYVDNNTFCPTNIASTIVDKPSFNFMNEVSVCTNDSIFFNNQWMNTSGIYQEIYTSQYGCDSIYTLNLSMTDTILRSTIIEFCEGDSIFVNGTWVMDETEITVYSTAVNGCDSVFVYNVKVVPTSFILDTFDLCHGDSIFVNNAWYFEGQTIDYVDNNSFCPTNISTTIIGKPSFAFIDEVNICPNDSILFQGNWISHDGSFLFEYNTQSGCDSIYTLNTYQISEPVVPTSEIDCIQLRHELFVPSDSAWTIQWSNGSTSNSTFYTQENEGTISYIHNEEECVVTYPFNLLQIPNETEIPIFGNTEVLPCEPLLINLSVDSTNWTVDWYQNGSLLCAHCFNTTLNSANGSNIQVTFQHTSGCDYTRNFSIGEENERGIYIPNIFWPHSTSGNDKWRIHIPECYHIELVKIYDRWGNMVSILDKPEVIEWDGIFKGTTLEQGVYTYIIHFSDDQNERNILSGDVTLIR